MFCVVGGEMGVGKRSRALVAMPVAGDGVSHNDGLPTPEVVRRLHQERRSRQEFRGLYAAKFKIAGGSARRMLRLLRLQHQRRARERNRGRIRLVLAERL